MARMSYPASLDKAWAAHLAPRAPNAPTVISLFAGCGGSSLGYSMAGFRELVAVDFDAKCAATFRANFPGVPSLVADLRELRAEDLMKTAGVASGELDVLDGSPPCQGFSTAGKRVLGDLRNQLYREFTRLLAELRPRAFVMENVPGMVKGKMKIVFADCMRALKATGYRVSCRILNAKWFGVPQERRRLIWVGIRNDLGVAPSHPRAQTSPISVAEAIGDLLGRAASLGNAPLLVVKNDLHENKWRAGGAPLVLQVVGMAAPFERKEWEAAQEGVAPPNGWRDAKRPASTVNANRPPVVRVENAAVVDDDGRKRGWPIDRPSFTVGSRRLEWKGSFDSIETDGDKPSPTQWGHSPHWVPSGTRQMTNRECARLQSFPDQFNFLGGKGTVMKQIGNSVPPLLARAVGRHVAGLLEKCDE